MTEPYAKKFRAWCFTINNPTAQDDPHSSLNEDNVDFAIWSLEQGENGTPHYQGYAKFKNARYLKGIKKLLPRAHLEPARGTDTDNQEYCSKAEGHLDGPWIIGKPGQQGKRSDWYAIRDEIKEENPTMERLASDYPMQVATCYGGVMRLKSIFTPPRTEMATTFVIFGEPGSGKTHYAVDWLKDCSPGVLPYQKEPDDKWWDLYDNQPTVLIDDFEGDIPFTMMKRMMDKYDFKGEVKGGYTRIPVKYVAITSNLHPNTWYDWSRKSLGALTRRVTKWVYFYDHMKYIMTDNYQDFCDSITGHGRFKTIVVEK